MEISETEKVDLLRKSFSTSGFPKGTIIEIIRDGEVIHRHEEV